MPKHIFREYIPPPIPKQQCQMKHAFLRRIAYGIQMRGDDYEVPTIIYYGAPFSLIARATRDFTRMLNGNVRGFSIFEEHSCRRRNGKAYDRIAVEIHGLNTDFMTVRSLVIALNNYIQKICHCTIQEKQLRWLLNL